MTGIGMEVTLVVKCPSVTGAHMDIRIFVYYKCQQCLGDMVLSGPESKKGRGRQGGPEQQLNRKDFSSDQEQARSNDRHVQHDVIVSGAAKDQ